MYKLTIPISLSTTDFYGEAAVLSELKRAGADEVYIHLPRNFLKDGSAQEAMDLFADKMRFFEKNRIEVTLWVSPLIGFSGSSEVGCEDFTRVKKLHDGAEYKGVFCPMDPNFSDAACDFIGMMAKTGVKKIMLDDEFCLSGRGDGGIGCCCDRHMQEYSRRIGEDISREELCKKAFLGEKNKYRDLWLDLQGETLVKFAEKLRQSVDKVNHDIRMGFCAGRTSWDTEGVDAITLTKALAGNTKPVLRLAGAPYWTLNSLVWHCGLSGVAEAARLQAWWCKGNGVEICSEGDVNPRPRFAVPAAYLEGFDMIMRADGSTDGIMKYMMDYFGAPTQETGYIDRHVRNQHLYEGIDEMFSGKKAVGVNVFENMSLLRGATLPAALEDYLPGDFPANNDKFHVMPAASQVFACENSLPVTYGDLSAPTIVFGENAAHVPADAPMLILDGTAAAIMHKRGVDVGLLEIRPERGAATELCLENKMRERAAAHERVYRVKCRDCAEIQSVFCGPAGEMPAMYRYKNKAGQKFIVYTFDAKDCRGLEHVQGAFFSGYGRQQMLISGIEWMMGKAMPAKCTGNPKLYMLCKKDAERMSVGLWNFCEDEIIEPVITLDREYKEIRFLGCEGHLSGNKVTLSAPMAPFSFSAIEVW